MNAGLETSTSIEFLIESADISLTLSILFVDVRACNLCRFVSRPIAEDLCCSLRVQSEEQPIAPLRLEASWVVEIKNKRGSHALGGAL